ncbi:MAG: glycoside hydrolase, partial [Flavobacterium sp.]
MKLNTWILLAFCCASMNQIMAQNPIIKNIFTADPAPIVHKGTLYLYTGHDVATETDTNYKMADWHVFSTTDMATWKDHGAPLSPSTFS